MHTEMTGVRTDVSDLKADVANLKTDVSDLKADMVTMKTNMADMQESIQTVIASQLRFEIEELPRIAAAIEGVMGSNDKNVEQDNRILVLENKSENQNIRITALEYALKA